MDKKTRLLDLARMRRTARWDGYNNLRDYLDGVYDCDHVSPWTKSAGNVDAEVMVFLQDWTSDDSDSLKKPVQELIDLGYRPGKPTNDTLIELLGCYFPRDLKDFYVTNLFPFVKMGEKSAKIPRNDMLRAAREYGLPQLEIVCPKLAICLGKSTYNALRVACGLDRVHDLPEAISSPFSHGHTVVFCQAHPAGRGSKDEVLNNWSRMSSLYSSIPSNRAEIAEWLANNINCCNTHTVVAAATAIPIAARAVAALAQARPGTVRYYCLQVLQANKLTWAHP